MKPTAFLLIPLTLALSMCAHSNKNHAEKRSTEELEAAFHRKDSNHDGYVSRDEFLANAKDRNKASRIFDKRDRNWDGKLSEQEFVTHITKAL